jgi:hypothetical protein
MLKMLAQGRINLFPNFGQRYAKPNVPVASQEYVRIAREAGLSPAVHQQRNLGRDHLATVERKSG